MPDIFLLCRYFLNVFSSMLFLLCFVFFLFPARENGVAQHACFCTLEPELFRRRNFSKLFLNSKKKSFSNSPAWENGVAPQAGFRVMFSLRSSGPGIRRRECALPSKLGACIPMMSMFADGGFFLAMTCCPEALSVFYPRRQCQGKMRRALVWLVMI